MFSFFPDGSVGFRGSPALPTIYPRPASAAGSRGTRYRVTYDGRLSYSLARSIPVMIGIFSAILFGVLQRLGSVTRPPQGAATMMTIYGLLLLLAPVIMLLGILRAGRGRFRIFDNGRVSYPNIGLIFVGLWLGFIGATTLVGSETLNSTSRGMRYPLVLALMFFFIIMRDGRWRWRVFDNGRVSYFLTILINISFWFGFFSMTLVGVLQLLGLFP